mmetsp:Transcript_1644/g.3369  ORF Transcript_1644/g.3369 Transcript_1644/m.3369 type:complete len:210 (+) Transcript_1644:1386-2015(+)
MHTHTHTHAEKKNGRSAPDPQSWPAAALSHPACILQKRVRSLSCLRGSALLIVLSGCACENAAAQTGNAIITVDHRSVVALVFVRNVAEACTGLASRGRLRRGSDEQAALDVPAVAVAVKGHSRCDDVVAVGVAVLGEIRAVAGRTHPAEVGLHVGGGVVVIDVAVGSVHQTLHDRLHCVRIVEHGLSRGGATVVALQRQVAGASLAAV